MSAVVHLAPTAVTIGRHKGRAQIIGARGRKARATFIVVYTSISRVGVFNNRVGAIAVAVNSAN